MMLSRFLKFRWIAAAAVACDAGAGGIGAPQERTPPPDAPEGEWGRMDRGGGFRKSRAVQLFGKPRMDEPQSLELTRRSLTQDFAV